MTAEEAKEIMSKVTFYWELGEQTLTQNQINEALDLAIKALEEQPCEDCISRQAVKETIFEQGSAEKLEIDFAKLLLLQRAIKALPSVTPKPKIGHWKWVQYDANPEIGNFHCSECQYIPANFNVSARKLNYCPNCGAKMSESEDEE